MTKKILITENITGPGIDGLKKKYDCRWDKELWQKPEELLRIADRYDAIIVRNQTKVNADLLKAATGCLVVGRAGVGVDNVDVRAATELGIVVAFTPEENAISVAEQVLGMMLCLARRFVGADASVKSGKWDRMAFMGVELYGKTLGVIGLGKIGARVAMRARAFGMRIIAYDPYLTRHHIHVTESQAELVDLETLLKTSDFMTIHLPLTAETQHLINRDRLSRMKPTAYLIKDQAALFDALVRGTIAGAAVDVLEQEPPDPADPLLRLPNIIITPHTSSWSNESAAYMRRQAAANVVTVLKGGMPGSIVNRKWLATA